MSMNVEGTLVMDGLIEARLPDDAQFEEKIREWVKLAKSVGLSFILEVDGRSFNLLPLEEPVQSTQIGANPSEAIAELLRQLLGALPKALRGKVISTLRSEEFKKDCAIQTVYLVKNGHIMPDQRTVDSQTIPAENPLAGKERAKLIGIGIATAIALFLISSVFIDYRNLISQTLEQVSPINPKTIQIQAKTFEGYFSIKKVTVPRSQRYLEVTIQRGKRFPSEKASSPEVSLGNKIDNHERLALEAVTKGYIRCEFFDKKGKFMGYSMERIKDLRQNKSIALRLPVSRKHRPSKVVLTY